MRVFSNGFAFQFTPVLMCFWCNVQGLSVAVMLRSSLREKQAAIESAGADQGRKVQRLIRREWLQKFSVRNKEAAQAEAEFRMYQSEFIQLKVGIEGV